MEPGVDYVDLARHLIQPDPNSYQQWQQAPSQQWVDQSMASAISPQPVAIQSNEAYFNLNRGMAGSPAGSLANNVAGAAASPTPTVDRAAQLRAQLLASRKMTPDPAKSNQPNSFAVTNARAGQPMGEASNNDPFARPATTQPQQSINADVEALIASAISKPHVPSNNSAGSHEPGEISNHDTAQNGHAARENGRNLGILHEANVDRRERPDSSHQRSLRRPEHGSPRETHDARRQSMNVRRTSMNSNGDNLERKRALDREREDRERAAAAYKANMSTVGAQRDTASRDKVVDTMHNDHSDYPVVNGTKPQAQPEPEQAAPTTRQTLESFDINTAPIEIVQWLEITSFYDEPYRTRELNRHNKRLELERQMRALEEEGLEDRTRIIRGPTAHAGSSSLARPASSSTAPTATPVPAPAPEPKKPEAASPSTTVKPLGPPPSASKRPRDEEVKPSEPRTKAIKTEPKSLESRITRTDDAPDRQRRRSPLAPQHSNYESYQPPPRDRYDGYGRGYGYDDREREREREQREREHERERERERVDRERLEREREREREREFGERERYGRLAFEDEEKDRGPAKKVKGKKQWSGIPCVPCRYYKQGNCHRGAACTFLHE